MNDDGSVDGVRARASNWIAGDQGAMGKVQATHNNDRRRDEMGAKSRAPRRWCIEIARRKLHPPEVVPGAGGREGQRQ